MGVEKKKSRFSDYIARACRLPREAGKRVSKLSETIAKERLNFDQRHHNFPYKYLSVAILILLFLPWTISLSNVIPFQAEVVLGSEIVTTPYNDYVQTVDEGVTHAVLLNSTPFTLSDDWVFGWDYWLSEFDLNSYGWNDTDGYHFSSSVSEYSVIFLSRSMQVPILNYSDITVSMEIEGVSGGAGVYLEAFVDEEWAVTEADVLPNHICQVNVSAPLQQARLVSDSWLCEVLFLLQIGLSEGAHVKVRSVIMTAEFTGKLNRVTFDIKNTENISLYENPSMRYVDYHPQIMIVQNNDTSSVGVYTPSRADDVVYLPPGYYEGVTFGDYNTLGTPDPNNSSTWLPDVSFTVIDDTELSVNVRLFFKRLDFELSPSVLIRQMSLFFFDNYQFSESARIMGSTYYSEVPEFLYIPGSVDYFTISLSTWSTLHPQRGWGWTPNDHLEISEQVTISAANQSANLILRAEFPYEAIGGAYVGLGDTIFLIFTVLLVAGFVVSIRRVLANTNLRDRLSDSRILPLIMLNVGILLPWSVQLTGPAISSYQAVSWMSWFTIPIMLRWTDSSLMQFFIATPNWWNSILISIVFLLIPLYYGYLSLASEETEEFNRRFALALILPYIAVWSGFSSSAFPLSTIWVGPILILAALPVWLVSYGFRRYGIIT